MHETENFIRIVSIYVNYDEIILILSEECMDLNQPPPEEPLSHSALHYSMIGSIHPTDSNEDSDTQIGGGHGASEAMSEWFTQLMKRNNDNNPYRALE